MPLYRVRFNLSTVVKAEDEKQALRLAFDQRQEIVRCDITDRNLGDIDVVSEITSVKDLPPGWNGYCIPWGLNCRIPYSMQDELNSTFWTELDKPVQLERERDLNEPK